MSQLAFNVNSKTCTLQHMTLTSNGSNFVLKNLVMPAGVHLKHVFYQDTKASRIRATIRRHVMCSHVQRAQCDRGVASGLASMSYKQAGESVGR
jgi:hypothetical protein